MSTTYSNAIDTIFNLIKTNWDTFCDPILGYTPEINWPGIELSTPPSSNLFWAKVCQETVDEVKATINSSSARYDTIGIISIEIYSPLSDATSITKLRQIVELTRNIFRICSGDVWFRHAKIKELNPTEKHHCIAVIAQYEYSEIFNTSSAISLPANSILSFLGLEDTPSSFGGSDGKYVAVNGEQLTFETVISAIWGNLQGDLADQVDLQTALNLNLKIVSNLNDVADRQAALNNITAVDSATDEYVLTKDTSTGNAIWKILGTLSASVVDNILVKGLIENYNPDIFDIGYHQDSDAKGYGTEYVANKLFSACRIGTSSVDENGAIKFTKDGVLQVYYDGEWGTIPTKVRISDDGNDFIVDYLPPNKTFWINIHSGDSNIKGLNSLPIIQEYKVSIGAYPFMRDIVGESFA